MLHLKSYVGSIVLAGLLLQGCGSSTDETSTQEVLSAQDIQTAATLTALTDTVNSFDGTESNETIKAKFDKLKIDLIKAENTSATSTQTAGVLSGLTDKLKDGLVGALDTSVGDAVTTAAFDVVLNSEGVTVVMIDLARKSATTSDIMVNAMEADWSLAEKMCPMLRESTEFGEKFTALAEEQDAVGRFFFERIDANMYGCLTDAMLLSNNDAVHDASVSHSTNGYMGLLMDRYATDYFIMPTGSTADRRNDKFVSLLLDTGANVDYNSTTKVFTGHGDANEIINEKFFYSLFKTPGTTDSFISAMEKIDTTTKVMLMDNIFLGQPNGEGEADTMQGYLNIISIGSAMYDGIYGVNVDGTRTGAYGFSSYAGAFVGFAGLIPGDRYMTYGKAFMNAGYQYAKFHGIDVWSGVSEAAKTAWNSYTSEDSNTTAQDAPARSAGLGIVGSAWVSDTTDLLWSAYKNFDINVNWSDLYTAITSSDKSIMAEITNQINGLKDSGNKAYHTLLDGKDDNNMTVLYTELSNGTIHNDTVYGQHGLVELAIQEDLYYVECGNRSTDYILTATPTCENNESYTMDSAKAAFTLPPFAEITWSYAYGTAKDGAMTYVKGIDADWIANLSSNDLIRQYFYPSAENVYIPNWMLAIDWLTVPANYTGSGIEDYDFAIDFNSGYLDVYVVSTNAALLTDINLPQAIGSIKTIEMVKVEMGSDSIIAVDEAGLNLEGLNVYKITVISAADAEAVLAYLGGLGDSALSAIGLDSSNTANVDTTDANTTTAE